MFPAKPVSRFTDWYIGAHRYNHAITGVSLTLLGVVVYWLAKPVSRLILRGLD